MLTTIPAAASYRRDLGDGLILRWSTSEDTANIAQLCSMVFREKATEPPNEFMANWIYRLMRGDHPYMGPGDYGVIEDTRKEGNPIIACTCLWRQEWTYEGLPITIGRPEIVASDPTYRNRGLIRSLFEMIHARSESEGHLIQAITGIPNFYRQFGYEYALDLEGKRITILSLIPDLKEGESEPYTLREATVEDIPFLMACYSHRRPQHLLWATQPESYWRYRLEGWKANPEKDHMDMTFVIVDTHGKGLGYILTQTRRRHKELGVWELEATPETNLLAVMPSVLRALQAYGLQLPILRPDTPSLKQIGLYLGRSHPVYDVLGEQLARPDAPIYAWYVRIPDVPAFIRYIAPSLEKRLANSALAGYSGEIKIDHYRKGLRMVLENGRVTAVEHWQVPAYDSNAGAGIPALIFTQLLVGYRDLDELRNIFPDVWANDSTRVLLKTLFPAQLSHVTG